MKKEAKQKNFKQILENAKNEEKIVKKMTALSIEKKWKLFSLKLFYCFHVGKIPVAVHWVQVQSTLVLQINVKRIFRIFSFKNLIFCFVTRCRLFTKFQFPLLQKFDWEKIPKDFYHCYLRIYFNWHIFL